MGVNKIYQEGNYVDTTYCIKGRRLIRKYDSRTIDEETIYKLIEAAIHAPPGCNMQAWKFIIVKSKEKSKQAYQKRSCKLDQYCSMWDISHIQKWCYS